MRRRLRHHQALEREGWTLTDILVTHSPRRSCRRRHRAEQKYNCRVVAPHDQVHEDRNADAARERRRRRQVGDLTARVLETPGHTLDHVSYVFDSEKALFAADTLFSIGCGRVFEGTYPQMWDSLLKLRALPTISNSIAAMNTPPQRQIRAYREPDNAALERAPEEVTRLRADNKPTVRRCLRKKKANVFLRADRPSVAAGVRLKGRTLPRCSRTARTQEQVLMGSIADRRRDPSRG